MAFQNFLFLLVDKRSVKKHISGPWSVFSVSEPESRMSFIWREIFALQTENIFAF
jgi:hypothetical protein